MISDNQDTPADIASTREQRLIARVQQGDTAAFAALVGRYVRRAHVIARRLMGNADEAEDLVHDTFLRALERITSFDRRRAFGPWFFRLLVNMGLDAHRKQRVRRTEPENLDAASTAPSPHQRLEGKEILDHLDAALATLPPQQRFIVWAYDVDGLSTEEIAQTLGITQVTVRSHLHRGRQALRKALRQIREC